MSNLGNLDAIAGKQFNMAVANTYGVNVMTSYGLPEATLIIASPTYNGIDSAMPTLFVSDANGNPCRLTYAIEFGNGLTADGDFISLNIDNKTIVNNDGVLDIATENIIDGKTINVGLSGKISVNTQLLEKTSFNKYGVYKLDGYTVQTVNDVAMVETEMLNKAMSKLAGVVTSDNYTLDITDGIMQVITKNLDKASENEYGVAMVDGNTLISKEGTIYVQTENISKSTQSQYGVVKIADKTITSKDGVLSVNTDALTVADKEYGVVKTDKRSIVSNEGIISIRDYETLRKNLSMVKTMSDELDNNIKELNEIIKNYSIASSKTPEINYFNCNHVTSAVLTTPIPGTLPDKLPSEKITAEFTINTNCPFYVSVTYDDNVSPGVFLYQMDYDRTDIYDGNTGIGKVMQSTGNEDKMIKFAFFCKNYAVDNSHEYSKHTKIHISINYIHDNTVGESIDFNIVRFNTMYGVENASELMKQYYKVERELIDVNAEFVLSKINGNYTNTLDLTNDTNDTMKAKIDGNDIAIDTEYTLSQIENIKYDTKILYYQLYNKDDNSNIDVEHISCTSNIGEFDANIVEEQNNKVIKLDYNYNADIMNNEDSVEETEQTENEGD